MKIIKTNLKEVLIIEPDIYKDHRGYFLETFHSEKFDEIGINAAFVQDNFSFSSRGVLRGLHYQISSPQGKLVRCVFGRVLDVVVDINPLSETFLQHTKVYLDDQENHFLWIPPGYAHGFVTLSKEAGFSYKCTSHYDPNDEGGIIWNDKTLSIDWGIDSPIVSSKDLKNSSIKDIF